MPHFISEEQKQEYWARKRAEKIKRQDKVQRVLDLVLAGLSFDQVATAMGYSNRGTPYKIWSKALKERAQASADENRSKYELRTNRLYRAAFLIATRNADKPGADTKSIIAAIDTAAKILRDQARVLGFEAPTQHRVGGAKGAAPIAIGRMINFGQLAEMSDAEIAEAREVLAGFAKAVPSGTPADGAGPGDGAPPEGADVSS